MMTKLVYSILVFICAAMPALATDGAGPVERIQVRGIGTVNYQYLFTEMSEKGQSLDSFAAQVAPRLIEYSAKSGFEACGAMATDGERFGVIVGTSRAHVACVNYFDKVPDGMVATDQTIHSHGRSRFNPNFNDRILQPREISGKGAFRGVAGQRVGGERLDEFSDLDFELPGYLAIPGGVIHQEGVGTVRTIMTDK